ncbi:phospholipase A1 3 [Leptinotarsa decemlineata]|uniref:phospholipase A1 3 n=1 Tax=Leptinotarsa decemlineata TaxID=7539 RepID=UPI003D308F37
MLLMEKLNVVLTFVSLVSGQFSLPNPFKSLKLPTPDSFLQKLFNVTSGQLVELVNNFSFEEILTEHVTFLWYQPDGSTIPLNLNCDGYHVDKDAPIKFVVHGWQSSGDQDFVKDMAKSYHKIGVHHVYGVDWSPHSTKHYLHSARGTKKIGEIVGQFVMNAISNNTDFLRNVHLIGHSLGAQVSGFAGKHIQELTTGLKVGRITGLDAASPLFEFPIPLPIHLRINREDAAYVDGIHTNAGFLGYSIPFGNADYYVNYGGPVQPGCYDINIFESFVCSHGKSHSIYSKTITNRKYQATSCSNPLWAAASLCNGNKKVVMGEHTTREAEGLFYINIDEKDAPKKGKLGISGLINKIPGLG